MGGHGIKDLEKFNRALRLRWLWYNWEPEERHWKNLFRLHDPTDRAIFFASTYIHIGDGKATPFWEAKWLHGVAPKDMAPTLFKIARYKKRSVHTEVLNDNWIKSLGTINNPAQLDEYVMMFLAISSVTLTDRKDKIIWRWTANEIYTMASSYYCQFQGAMTFSQLCRCGKPMFSQNVNYLHG
jgi:hypothetical protein